MAGRYSQRASTGYEKKILGVPVFPGMSPQHNNNNSNSSHLHGNTPQHLSNQGQQQQNINNELNNNNDSNRSDQTTPQLQQHLINTYNNNNNSHNGSHGNHHNNEIDYNKPQLITIATTPKPHLDFSNANNNWKLRHIDFMPAILKNKKEEEYEKFNHLVEKANEWASLNQQNLIFSCETVTWFSVEKPIFTDSGVMTKSMNSDKKTKFIRGLRLWYFVFEEVFIDKNQKFSNSSPHSPHSSPSLFKLGYINYVCDIRNEINTFSQLFSKINLDVNKRIYNGKIIRIETLDLTNDLSDPDSCVWLEQPEKARSYTSYFRVLFTFKNDDSFFGEVGMMDFLPFQDNRTPHNSGYEVYGDLWRKAAQWLYNNPNFRFINSQGVFVKMKKDTDTQHMTLWEKCTHCEHGTAYGSYSGQRTDYLQILRIFYFKTPFTSLSNSLSSLSSSSAQPSNGFGNGDNVQMRFGKKLFYKTFAPGTIKRVSLGNGVNSSKEEEESLSVDMLYEDLRQVEEKINSWLVLSGAKVAGVETILTRLGSGGQEILASEATMVYNLRERNLSREPWKVNIRMVLEGESKDLPELNSSDQM